MMVNNALSRGLGNTAKVYLMRCGQSTCAELKKFEFCPVGHGGTAHYLLATKIKDRNFCSNKQNVSSYSDIFNRDK